ncbi:aspartate--tRNA ligase [Candidatus Palauibacter sp.]|uniref:aspartate--tRNA ligase n=1 Tax=Candidatus Palauibacter sp. TaxID=3101350 RepID=UPI003B0190A1
MCSALLLTVSPFRRVPLSKLSRPIERREPASLETAWRDAGCGQIEASWVEREVRVVGWVHRRRDLGGLFFVDLRDRTGLLQLSFGPEWTEAAGLELVTELNPEDVVQAAGVVTARPEANPDMLTGDVEVRVTSLRRVSVADPLPILVYQPPDEELPSEELRLRHRILDLRRPEMQHNLRLRHVATNAVRDSLTEQGFVEIETPLLTRQTPEGARDYLVPSRVHQGRFFALPQSPQLYKQLLVCAGFDRYFQIAKCLRDEDLRADRQPEFTQIDVEMAFVEQDDVFNAGERMFRRVWRDGLDRDLPVPFPRLPHAEAMERYGTDKPDLRIPWEIRDFTPALTSIGFGIFDAVARAGGRVRGLVVPGGGALSRSRIAHYDALAREAGAKGALWLKRTADGWSGPPAKVVGEEIAATLEHEFGVGEGDLIFLVAGPDGESSPALDQLRRAAAREVGTLDESREAWLWITEFPLYEQDAETGLPVPAQHAFTMPADPDPERLREDPLSVTARAYDLVFNGIEFASGSIRCHLPEVQRVILEATGLTPEEVEARFGFLLEAFRYGVPPHGGFAVGMDRLVAEMVGCASIRDVIAFPKTAAARGLLERSPSPVTAAELEELGISVRSET